MGACTRAEAAELFVRLGRPPSAAGRTTSLRARVEMSPRPLQQAPFRVLVGANMPAVLVEIGYLSHPDEEKALASGAHQDRVAGAIFDAISRFRDEVERPAP